MSQYAALIIDDDKNMRESLSDLLGAAGWSVRQASSARDGLRKLSDVDAVVSDVRMPGMTGLELLAEATDDGHPPIVLISAHGDIPTAVSAMQAGAYTFLEKPFEPQRLLQALTHAAEQHHLKREAAALRARVSELAGLDRKILGASEDMADLRQAIEDLAPLSEPVLIAGETGTGKDLVARSLHGLSPRADKPFVVLNCATITQETLEHRLFGAQGAARAAESGTLFLDELAACPGPVQSQLLHFVETGHLPGGGAPIELRLIAATNVNLPQAISEGAFREDLFFRLAPLQIALTPLRARQADIVPLLAHFVSEYASAHGLEPPTPSPTDLRDALAHGWPGNVREVRAVALRWVLGVRRGVLEISHAIAFSESEPAPKTLRESVASFERAVIAQAIEETEGGLDRVAERLGIGRRTLNEKLTKLGLS